MLNLWGVLDVAVPPEQLGDDFDERLLLLLVHAEKLWDRVAACLADVRRAIRRRLLHCNDLDRNDIAYAQTRQDAQRERRAERRVSRG